MKLCDCGRPVVEERRHIWECHCEVQMCETCWWRSPRSVSGLAHNMVHHPEHVRPEQWVGVRYRYTKDSGLDLHGQERRVIHVYETGSFGVIDTNGGGPPIINTRKWTFSRLKDGHILLVPPDEPNSPDCGCETCREQGQMPPQVHDQGVPHEVTASPEPVSLTTAGSNPAPGQLCRCPDDDEPHLSGCPQMPKSPAAPKPACTCLKCEECTAKLKADAEAKRAMLIRDLLPPVRFRGTGTQFATWSPSHLMGGLWDR